MPEVKLHAYDITIGWHVGVEIYGREYYFDGHPDFKGVLYDDNPGYWAGKTSEVTSLGHVDKAQAQVDRILDDLKRNEYTAGRDSPSSQYSLLTHNCQDFAESFCYHLGCLKVPAKYTRMKDALRLKSESIRDVFGGAGPSGNMVAVRLGDVPENWGCRVYTYTAADSFHCKSYFNRWLQRGQRELEWVSAGQQQHEDFCICVHDGQGMWGRCLTGDHWCKAGDSLLVSYDCLWSVAHFRDGEEIYTRRSES